MAADSHFHRQVMCSASQGVGWKSLSLLERFAEMFHSQCNQPPQQLWGAHGVPRHWQQANHQQKLVLWELTWVVRMVSHGPTRCVHPFQQ